MINAGVVASALSPYANKSEADEFEIIARRWVEKIVIGLNLCPFAKAVHAKKQVRYVVTRAIHADDLLAEVEHEIGILMEADPIQIDTTLLIHPLAMLDFLDYHFFCGEADAAIKRLSAQGVLQIAGFHPDYCFAGSEPSDAANYTNRSPHPMLHLLRESSVAKAALVFPDAADIFSGNIDKLRKLGVSELKKL